MTMRAGLLAVLVLGMCAGPGFTAPDHGKAAPAAVRFTRDGRLVPPSDWREWVFLGAGLDMSYTDAPPDPKRSVFNAVWVDRVSWTQFKATGHWRDGAAFVLENRVADSGEAPLAHGKVQTGAQAGVEMHVRDDKRFAGGWGFFALDGDKPAPMIPAIAPCYACHQAHGAVDTTFTQFYPAAREIAKAKGTYRTHAPGA